MSVALRIRHQTGGAAAKGVVRGLAKQRAANLRHPLSMRRADDRLLRELEALYACNFEV